jgi:ribulose-5-phosphate 4-epimerase/fuculose-1-phosphate aldolase
MTDNASTAIRELVVANRILGNEGVVDAFGHISVRHSDNAGRYFLACSRSPGLVTEEDIVEFDLDSNRLDDTDRAIYAERFIHGCIYKARPDVMSVCHSHAHAVVPFTVTNTPIEPIWVMSSGSGAGVPNWDIRDEFPNEGTMLVVNDATGRSLAKTLGNGRVCLLRGHGAVIATGNLKATVMVSIGLMCNAQMLIQAHTLSQGRGDAAVNHQKPRRRGAGGDPRQLRLSWISPPRDSSAPRRLDCSDVDLLHGHHRIERALCFNAAGRQGFGQYTRRDLPRHAPLVFAPAAFALLAAIADDGVPIAIGLGLIVSGDLERKGFAMFERGTAVEADTRDAGNFEFDYQHISLLAGWVVTRCTVDGTHRAVGKGLGIKASSSLGILIVPDANRVLCHCISFRFEARVHLRNSLARRPRPPDHDKA